MVQGSKWPVATSLHCWQRDRDLGKNTDWSISTLGLEPDLSMTGTGESCMTGSSAAEMRAQTLMAEDLVLDLECWDDAANWNRFIFDFAVKKAAGFGNIGQFELALQWCSLAGWFASRHGYCGKLSSVELEAELLRAAKSLPLPMERTRQSPPRRWLHVLSAGYETLGHTNLCRRWIEYSADLVHDVILLEQSDSIPKNLNAVVQATGGQCIALDTATSLLDRAALLRTYAMGAGGCGAVAHTSGRRYCGHCIWHRGRASGDAYEPRRSLFLDRMLDCGPCCWTYEIQDIRSRRLFAGWRERPSCRFLMILWSRPEQR